MPLYPGAIFGIVTSVIAVVGAAGAIIAFVFLNKTKKVTLTDPNVKFTLRLVDKENISHDTRRFKFALPTPEHILGLPVGNHVYMSARVNGELVVRPYTPVTLNSTKGYTDFIIKIYKSGTNDRFPQGGKLTQFLDQLPINGLMEFRGPAGHLTYTNDGVFKVRADKNTEPREVKALQISIIAGGTGITPILQVVTHICRQEKNTKIKMRLLYANNTEDDILAREEIEKLASDFPLQFRYWYTLTTAPQNWKHSVGFVSAEMIQEQLFPPGPDHVVLICGPPPMVDRACKPNLTKLNYPEDRTLVF